MAESGPGVAPPLAVAYVVVGYFAVLIAGFGLASLAGAGEVIAVHGLGQLPGILGVAASALALAIMLLRGLRGAHPGYGQTILVVVVTFLATLVGIALGALMDGSGIVPALAAVGRFAVSWFALLLAADAFVAAWIAVALVRTRARRPRWPWERDEEE